MSWSRRIAVMVGLAAVFCVPIGVATAQIDDKPGADRDGRRGCIGRVERCGASVVVGEELRGVDNCRVDPNCLTRRIVDNRDPARGTDFMPVPDAGDSGAGDEDAAQVAAADGEDGDGAPACTPRAAGRITPDFAQVDLPAGRIGANPYHEHLTGLESWFWYEGETTLTWASPVFVGVTADCQVAPAPAPDTYRAELVGFVWQVADGRPQTYHAAQPGTDEHPAVRHMYETKGAWSVAVACTWQGAWGARVSVPCGEREIDVIEIRARLRDG